MDDQNILSESKSFSMEMENDDAAVSEQQQQNDSAEHQQDTEPPPQNPTPYDDNEEVVVEDSSAGQKKQSKRWEKERQSRQEKYILTEALAEEKRKNLELEQYLRQTVDINTETRTEGAVRAVAEAEYLHAKALEEGDANSVSRAATNLMQANLELNRVANSKRYTKEDTRDYSKINPTLYANKKLLQDWLYDNPELNPASDNYNLQLVKKLSPLIHQLDAKIKLKGQTEILDTPEYFDILDTIVSRVKGARKNDGNSYVGPVNSSFRSGIQNTTKVHLTREQQAVAAACNMTESQYANWIKKYDRDKKEGENYGY